MNNYILSEDAELDLVEIWDYIAEDNINAADNLVDKIFESFKKLSQMPNMGHRRPEWTKRNLRFWNIKRYLVIYQINENKRITIIRVLNGFRDIAELLDTE